MSSNTKRSLKSLHLLQKPNSTSNQRYLRGKTSQHQIEQSGDEIKTEQALIKQIQLAKREIQKFVKELDFKGFPKEAPRENQACIKLIYDMQAVIEEKNIQINTLNQQIKVLKTQPASQIKDQLKKTKNVKNFQLLKLTQQILKQKSLLYIAQNQHKKVKNQLQINKQSMRKTQQNYNNDTASRFRKLITYQQFLQQKKYINQDIAHRQRKKGTKKYFLSIKQFLKNEQYSKNKNLSSNNLKDAQAKRQIAESALKVAKKKHQTEMNEMRGKLQFLKDQNQQLNIKLKHKTQELQSAENRFSQSKKILNQRH